MENIAPMKPSPTLEAIRTYKSKTSDDSKQPICYGATAYNEVVSLLVYSWIGRLH